MAATGRGPRGALRVFASIPLILPEWTVSSSQADRLRADHPRRLHRGARQGCRRRRARQGERKHRRDFPQELERCADFNLRDCLDSADASATGLFYLNIHGRQALTSLVDSLTNPSRVIRVRWPCHRLVHFRRLTLSTLRKRSSTCSSASSTSRRPHGTPLAVRSYRVSPSADAR